MSYLKIEWCLIKCRCFSADPTSRQLRPAGDGCYGGSGTSPKHPRSSIQERPPLTLTSLPSVGGRWFHEPLATNLLRETRAVSDHAITVLCCAMWWCGPFLGRPPSCPSCLLCKGVFLDVGEGREDMEEGVEPYDMVKRSKRQGERPCCLGERGSFVADYMHPCSIQ